MHDCVNFLMCATGSSSNCFLTHPSIPGVNIFSRMTCLDTSLKKSCCQPFSDNSQTEAWFLNDKLLLGLLATDEK